MLNAIKQLAIVGANGKIELMVKDFPTGALVDVLIFQQPDEIDTTDYLLSTESSRKYFSEAIEQLNRPDSFIYIDPAKL